MSQQALVDTSASPFDDGLAIQKTPAESGDHVLLMDDFYLVVYVNNVDNDVVGTVVIRTMQNGDQVSFSDTRKIADKHQIL